MKLNHMVSSFALLLTTTFAFAQGIAFEKTGWADALAKAKAENKLIFLDAFTSWCGPCKMMDKNTFTDPKVGQLYNARFVNMQIDMEKGEGLDIARRYEVNAYPTLLFINAEGKVMHRGLGYRDAAQFIALGEDALDPNKSLGALTQRYEQGERSPEFMRSYIAAKAAAFDPQTGQIVESYLDSQPNPNTPENRELIFNHIDDPNSKYFTAFLENEKDYTAQFGADKVAGKKQQAVADLLRTKTLMTPETAKPKIEQWFGADAPQYVAYYNLMYQQRMGNKPGFIDAAIVYFDQAKDAGSMELNEIAWFFYENVDDQDKLRHALAWAERSVKLEEAYANLDTLAALHYKLGNQKQAKKYAQKAIDKAKENGEDYSSTEELLKKMK